MSLFLSALPLWITAILLVVIPTIIACCGLILVRRHVGLERLTTNNEVAGFKFAVVGVIYAVLMAFAIVVVWQRYTDAELAVVSEAGAAATLYRLAAGPEPAAREVRRALAAYLTLAIERDWPQMAREQESAEANQGLDALYTAALHMDQTALRPSAVLVPIFNQIDLITEARRSRLHLAVGIMPGVLWAALILGGGLTVAFTYFFGTENLKAQVLMSGILAVIVFMGLFVIVSIDHPFTGPVHVDPGPLQRVLSDFRG
ncbi:MAG TPA: DUF4239 domain-containing protein [Steroidobacteraceae bacterium]|nr:DUF4239 domain-containing protein [Steroidobacteraceae bacterium]